MNILLFENSVRLILLQLASLLHLDHIAENILFFSFFLFKWSQEFVFRRLEDLRFSKTTGILQKKSTWFIGVEVELETSASPPKKNPGSAPVAQG